MTACPPDSDLARFLADQLPAADEAGVRAHLDGCHDCQERADRLARSADPDWVGVRVPQPRDDFELGVLAALRSTLGPPSPPPSRPPTDPGDTAVTFPPGFEPIRALGTGGMGEVYLARQVRPNRLVAVKLAGRWVVRDDWARLRAEAETVARLQHPNIVQLYEVGETADGPYLVMEYLAGGTLAELAGGRPHPPRDGAAVVRELASAVQHAHDHGVVHRDVKPSNVLLASAPGLAAGNRLGGAVPKLGDFGLAVRPGDLRLTRPGAVVGTPAAMAPEQAAGRGAGPAADVYGLGAVLYELLTGRPPLLGDGLADTLRQVLHVDPIPPRRLAPTVPRDLETVCLKCLEKSPAARYPTARALAEDLTRFLTGRPVAARPLSPAGRAARWARRNPVIAGLAAGLVALTVAGLSALAVQNRLVAAARDAAAAERDEATRSRAAAEQSLYFGLIAQADLYARQGDVPLAAQSLAACPPHLRHWEWYHLNGLLRSELRTFPAGAPWTYAVGFSPDGRLLATGGGYPQFTNTPEKAPGSLRVWEVETGLCVLDLAGKTLAVTSVAFGPGGGWVAAAEIDIRGTGTGPLRAWDVATGRELWRAAPRAYNRIVVSPDGRSVVAQTIAGTGYWHNAFQALPELPGGVVVFDAATGAERFALTDRHGCQLTAGGRELRSWAADWHEEVHDLRTGARLRRGGAAPVRHADRGPDGGPALERDPASGAVLVRDPADDRLLRVVPTAAPADTALAIAPAGRPAGRVVATGDPDGVVRLWPVRGGDPTLIRGHTDRLLTVAFSPSGDRLASGGWDGTAKVWDLTRPLDHLRVGPPLAVGRGESVDAMAYRGGAKLITLTAPGGRLSVWSADGASEAARVLPAVSAAVVPGGRFAFANKGRWLVGPVEPGGTAAGVWDVDTGAEVVRFAGHAAAVNWAVPSAAGGRVATAAELAGPTRTDLTVRDTGTGQTIFAATAPGRLTALALDPAGATVAAAYRRAAPDPPAVRVWDVATARELPAPAPSGVVHALAFAPAGRSLAWSDDAQFGVWDPEAGRPVASSPARETVYDLALTPDGRRVAGASRGNVVLRDPTTGRLVLTLHGPPRVQDPPFNPRAAFGPDGQLAASQWDGTVFVWQGRYPGD